MEPRRRHLAGVSAIEAALRDGAPLRVLLVGRDDSAPEIHALVEHARSRGVSIWLGSPGDLRRMSRGETVERAIAMLGPAPEAELEALLARDGAVWLLHQVAYASNIGFAVRTAEVSGADGLVLDGDFNHDERARIGHVSMGADRLLPVLYADTERTLTLCRALGRKVIAIEDVGDRAPWELDLSGRVLLIVGNERDGLPATLLRRCDAVTALPMAGFVPSYNLQAAISGVAIERLRQLTRRRSAP